MKLRETGTIVLAVMITWGAIVGLFTRAAVKGELKKPDFQGEQFKK